MHLQGEGGICRVREGIYRVREGIYEERVEYQRQGDDGEGGRG